MFLRLLSQLLFINFLLATAVESSESSGMPQLNPEFWLSQIFWLIITFGILLVVLSKLILPKISENLEIRKTQILENIASAENQRKESDAKLKEYEKIIIDSKNEAKNYFNKAREKIVKDIDNFDGWNSSIYKGKDIWSMDYVWGKPYLSSGLIPSQIRKKWLLNNPDFNLAKRVIDSYGDYLLPDNLDWVNDDKGRFMPKWLYRKRTIRKCLLYLAIIEKHATKKFSDVNPEVYQYLQEAAR